MSLAMHRGSAVVNPASQATPPSAASAKTPEMRVWSGPQVRRFLELCDDDRYRWPWLFLATTGCRRGEALGLRWADVDFDRSLATIRQELIPLTKASGKGREGVIVPTDQDGQAEGDRARHPDDGRAALLEGSPVRGALGDRKRLPGPRPRLHPARRPPVPPRSLLQDLRPAPTAVIICRAADHPTPRSEAHLGHPCPVWSPAWT